MSSYSNSSYASDFDDDVLCQNHRDKCECSSVSVCDHCRRWCFGESAWINPKLKRDMRGK